MTEKAGKAEAVTEFDKEFETLCDQMEQIKAVTERMLVQMEVLMQPNPSEPRPLFLLWVWFNTPSGYFQFPPRCASGGLGQD